MCQLARPGVSASSLPRAPHRNLTSTRAGTRVRAGVAVAAVALISERGARAWSRTALPRWWAGRGEMREPARNDGGEKGDLVKSPDLTSTQFALVPPAFFAPQPTVPVRSDVAGIPAVRDLTAISPRSHRDLTSPPAGDRPLHRHPMAAHRDLTAGRQAAVDLTAISPPPPRDHTDRPLGGTGTVVSSHRDPTGRAFTSPRSHRDRHCCQARDQQPQAEVDQGGAHHGNDHDSQGDYSERTTPISPPSHRRPSGPHRPGRGHHTAISPAARSSHRYHTAPSPPD